MKIFEDYMQSMSFLKRFLGTFITYYLCTGAGSVKGCQIIRKAGFVQLSAGENEHIGNCSNGIIRYVRQRCLACSTVSYFVEAIYRYYASFLIKIHRFCTS